MALREARCGLRALLLSMSCVTLGVASFVAVASFRNNLETSINEQSKSLLGADLAIESRQPLSREAEAWIASLGGEQSRQISFSSMASFPESNKARLVQVRALAGGFPYYGALETEPSSASKEFQAGPFALVDETLMFQFGLRLGDRLRIGDHDFRIAGKLRKIPGETLAFSLISPRVYISLAQLDQSQLLAKGSIVRYRVYLRLDPGVDADQLVQRISPQLEVTGKIRHLPLDGESFPLPPAGGLHCRFTRGGGGGQRHPRLQQRKDFLGGAAPLHRRQAG